MTYLLLQTFLLLLASYFCGAFVACVAKQIMRGRQRVPAYAGQWDRSGSRDSDAVPLIPIQSSPTQNSLSGNIAASTAAAAAAAAAAATRAPRDIPRVEVAQQSRGRVTSPAREIAAPPPRSLVPSRPRTPRVIEPVQPKIDVVPRPAPRPAPPIADVGRFDRALTGPELNAGMPRTAVVELRPAVLKFATGPALPWVPPPKLIAAPIEVAQADALDAAPASETSSDEGNRPSALAPEEVQTAKAKPRRSEALTASITQAAAAAVAAAKSAVAALAPAKKDEPDIALPNDEDVSDASNVVASPKGDAERANGKRGVDSEPVKIPEPASPAGSSASDRERAEPTAKKPAPVVVPASQPKIPAAKPIVAKSSSSEVVEGGDDLQRIRAITPEVEQGLKSLGMMRFEDIARWTLAEISVIDEMLELSGRIDREQWIEQAQILAKGGETYYSRNRASAAKRAAPEKPAMLPSASVEQSNEQKNAGNDQPSSGAGLSETSTSVKHEDGKAEPQVNADVAEPAAVAPQAQGKSVSEIAAAAAAAIAAASASVTRGRRPVEQISPLSKADPNVVMPTKLSAAIKERVAKDASDAVTQFDKIAPDDSPAVDDASDAEPGGDDLKRIRGIGVLIEKRLKSLGVTTYDQIANWTSGDIDRISQTLDFKGRVERENWVEQARILSSGGQTEFSRRVDRGDVESSRE